MTGALARIRVAVAGAPPWLLAVCAMLSIQLGAAWSVPIIQTLGPAGAGWLRLLAASVMFLTIARPKLRQVRKKDVPVLVGLGISTAVMTLALFAAIDRIPLGTAVAVEFLGPLAVAAIGGRNWKRIIWPFVALAGVILMTEPWHGRVDLVGVAFAALAAAGWGGYIVLTQLVGDRFEGFTGLAITIPIATLVTTPMGIADSWGKIDLTVVVLTFGVAIANPVLPYMLELLALRRMDRAAFGTLVALEPAAGLLMGAIILAQMPDLIQIVGIGIVIVAGTVAQRWGSRTTSPDDGVDGEGEFDEDAAPFTGPIMIG